MAELAWLDLRFRASGECIAIHGEYEEAGVRVDP